MKVNGVTDEMGRLKLGDLTSIQGQQLADGVAQDRVLAVNRPDQAVPGAWFAALSRWPGVTLDGAPAPGGWPGLCGGG